MIIKPLILAAAVAAVSASAMAEEITLAYSPSVFTAQFDIAKQQELFAKAGLEVKFINFQSGREAMEALTGGQADVASITEFPAATGILRDQKFVIIADVSRYTGTRLIADKRSGDPKNLSTFADKSIGTTLGTNADYALRQALKGAGITPTVVNVAPSDLIPSLVSGNVAAAVPFAGVDIVAKRALKDNYADVKLDYVSHFLMAVSQDWLKEHETEAKTLIKVLGEGTKIIAENQDASAAAVSQAFNGVYSQDEVKTLWQDADFNVIAPEDVLPLIKDEQSWILQQGVISGEVPQDLKPWVRTDLVK